MASGFADRRRHGCSLHSALVLVAHQRLERDLGYGVLADGDGRFEPLAAVLRQQLADVCQERPGDNHCYDDCMAGGDPADQARAGRHSAVLLSACSARRARMETCRSADTGTGSASRSRSQSGGVGHWQRHDLYVPIWSRQAIVASAGKRSAPIGGIGDLCSPALPRSGAELRSRTTRAGQRFGQSGKNLANVTTLESKDSLELKDCRKQKWGSRLAPPLKRQRRYQLV